jgi:hypothetical protein
MGNAQMQYLGEIEGQKCYWAEPGHFERPGFWYWDGYRNLHVPIPPAPMAPPQAPKPVAHGWQLVPALLVDSDTEWPVEMNDMAEAFFKAYECAQDAHGFYESFYAAWCAALAVAPKKEA